MPTLHRLRSLAALMLTTLLVVLGLVAAGPIPGAGAQTTVPGVQLHLLWSNVDEREMDRQLELAKDANAGLVRVDVGWAALEGGKKGEWNAYHLGRLDRAVAKADALDLKLLLTFWTTPCWASSAPASVKQDCRGNWSSRGVQLYAPNRSEDYADALGFLVGRYGTRVAGWEVWNEPNSEDFWRSPGPVTDYVDLVKAAYRSAKAADPRVPIAAGALMHADFAWTEKLYARGIKGHFDAFSIHPYSEDRSPLRSFSEYKNVSFVDGIPAVRDVMTRYGDERPLWLTELGWSTTTVRDAPAWINGVSETMQARYIAEALDQAKNWDYVDVIILYNLVDKGSDKSSLQDNFGLVRTDGREKPGLAAFREGAARLDDPPPPGAPEPSAPAPVAPRIEFELSAPTSPQAPVVSTPLAPVIAGPDEGATSSTTMRGGPARRLAVASRPGEQLRVRGKAPGRSKVRVKVRRLRRGGTLARAALSTRLPVSADGRFSRRLAIGKLERGAYRVTVSGGASHAQVVLRVR